MNALNSLDQLKSAGIEEHQARALVAVIGAALENVATKEDLNLVQKDVNLLKTDVNDLKTDVNTLKKDVHIMFGKLSILVNTIYGILGVVVVNMVLTLLHYPFR